MCDSARRNALVACAFLVPLLAASSGCALVRTAAGGNVDVERLRLARETAMLDLRTRAARDLARRLRAPDPVDNADALVVLSEAVLDAAAQATVGAVGRIDEETSYRIAAASVRLYPGSAVATLRLVVRSERYDVTADLVLDCALALRLRGGELVAEMEPFDVVPTVSAGGVLGPFEDVIRDVIAVRVSRLGADMPPIAFPVEFDNRIALEKSAFAIPGKPNLAIDVPRRVVDYRMRIKEVLFFEGRAVVALNLDRVDVK